MNDGLIPFISMLQTLSMSSPADAQGLYPTLSEESALQAQQSLSTASIWTLAKKLDIAASLQLNNEYEQSNAKCS